MLAFVLFVPLLLLLFVAWCSQSLVLLLAEDDDDLVLKSWRACEAVAATIPKEDQASHVLAFKEAVAGAKEKERRKRRGGVLQLRGLLLPNKALAPFVPIYLQGVLQVSSWVVSSRCTCQVPPSMMLCVLG